jgi:hypothetical protein
MDVRTWTDTGALRETVPDLKHYPFFRSPMQASRGATAGGAQEPLPWSLPFPACRESAAPRVCFPWVVPGRPAAASFGSTRSIRGVVYVARQLSLKGTVALKVLAGGLGLTPKAVQRFRREAEAAAGSSGLPAAAACRSSPRARSSAV